MSTTTPASAWTPAHLSVGRPRRGAIEALAVGGSCWRRGRAVRIDEVVDLPRLLGAVEHVVAAGRRAVHLDARAAGFLSTSAATRRLSTSRAPVPGRSIGGRGVCGAVRQGRRRHRREAQPVKWDGSPGRTHPRPAASAHGRGHQSSGSPSASTADEADALLAVSDGYRSRFHPSHSARGRLDTIVIGGSAPFSLDQLSHRCFPRLGPVGTACPSPSCGAVRSPLGERFLTQVAAVDGAAPEPYQLPVGLYASAAPAGRLRTQFVVEGEGSTAAVAFAATRVTGTTRAHRRRGAGGPSGRRPRRLYVDKIIDASDQRGSTVRLRQGADAAPPRRQYRAVHWLRTGRIPSCGHGAGDGRGAGERAGIRRSQRAADHGDGRGPGACCGDADSRRRRERSADGHDPRGEPPAETTVAVLKMGPGAVVALATVSWSTTPACAGPTARSSTPAGARARRRCW